ncbi:MAG: SH3 beta-barrel fold-containing protein [Clostridia bacterium]
MKTAHKLFKTPNWFKTWSETLKTAWSIIKDKLTEIKMTTLGSKVILKDLNNLLINQSSPVTFGYYKKDGSFRVFNATKNMNIIPIDNHPTGNSNASNLRFYDFNADAWRGLANNTTHVFML